MDKYLCIKTLYIENAATQDIRGHFFIEGKYYERRPNKFKGTEDDYFILRNEDGNRYKDIGKNK